MVEMGFNRNLSIPIAQKLKTDSDFHQLASTPPELIYLKMKYNEIMQKLTRSFLSLTCISPEKLHCLLYL